LNTRRTLVVSRKNCVRWPRCVGFYYGAFLPDAQGMLVGTGKRMRHVKLFPGEEHDEEALRELIRQSYLGLRKRLES
jgi:hypothetical protein